MEEGWREIAALVVALDDDFEVKGAGVWGIVKGLDGVVLDLAELVGYRFVGGDC